MGMLAEPTEAANDMQQPYRNRAAKALTHAGSRVDSSLSHAFSASRPEPSQRRQRNIVDWVATLEELAVELGNRQLNIRDLPNLLEPLNAVVAR